MFSQMSYRAKLFEIVQHFIVQVPCPVYVKSLANSQSQVILITINNGNLDLLNSTNVYIFVYVSVYLESLFWGNVGL